MTVKPTTAEQYVATFGEDIQSALPTLRTTIDDTIPDATETNRYAMPAVIEPVIAHTATEHATQLAFVHAGLGAAVIPRLGRGVVPDGVRMVRSSPILHRRVFARE